MLIGEDNLIWSLYLEGAAEDMITSSLRKMNATPEEISLFLKKDNNNKNLYKPEHVSILFNWVKNANANVRELEGDYKNYLKFFPNVKLNQFNSYIDWTEKVHAKRDEASYQSRNKEIGDIDVEGQDKENVLANDEDVLILKGDDEHKCVRYGKGYSFCISRPFGGNMYGNYRLSKASTFYFIYFKKIPKDDERHIMVLDRTQDGWEWTFGKNDTRVIEGGWDKIVKTFPVLAKYESLFVNKPLNDEEINYQKQLNRFVNSPSLEEFNQFTYEQKADVLKFGMLIPLDVFKSLNKYLRNEWISVGPKMSDDIYKLLKENEIKRFEEVRKQQLSQKEPEDIYDFEICNKDPELYDKHIKPDLELGLKQEEYIKSLIDENGVIHSEIKYDSKYHPLKLDNLKIVMGIIDADSAISISLPQLQQNKGIYANKATSFNLPQLQEGGIISTDSITSLNLPQLQKCGYIKIYSATNISLPQLQECGNIYSEKATSLSLPQLQKCKDIYAKATSLNLPQLQECGDIFANEATSISLPQLQDCINIYSKKATSLSLPQLQKCGKIYAKATSLNLPQLQKCKDIEAKSATNLNLPKLKGAGIIYASSAKKIIVPSIDGLFFNNVPEDCEIIETNSKETIKDSRIYNLMKSFLLKS